MSTVNNTPSKSTAKQSVVAVAVLLIICIVCVGLLALLNDLLYVTDQERFNRAMQSIYDADVDFVKQEQSEWNTSFTTNQDYGSVKGITIAKSKSPNEAKDVAVVMETTGIGGFSGGTVTIYIVINIDKADTEGYGKIISWSIKENVGQSYIGRFGESQYKSWYVGTAVTGDLSLTDSVKVSGATASSRAINNAVNMAAHYASNVLLEASDPTGMVAVIKAMITQAGLDLTVGQPANATNLKKVSHLKTVQSGEVTSAYQMTSGAATYWALVYQISDSSEVAIMRQATCVATTSPITGEAQEVVAKTDNITEELVTVIESLYVSARATINSIAIDGDNTIYDVVSGSVGDANAYTFRITIGADGAVKTIVVVVDGWVDHGPSHDDANASVQDFVGATIGTVSSIFDNSVVGSGATNSGEVARNAVALCLLSFTK